MRIVSGAHTHRNLMTLAYIAILALLVLVAWVEHQTFHRQLQANATTAHLVDIIGRQRMLSQRIGLFADELVESTSEFERNRLRVKLREEANLMAESHDLLIHPSEVTAAGTPLPLPIRQVYFSGKHPLDRQIREFVRSAHQLAGVPDRDLTTNNPDLLELESLAESEQFLASINKVIRQYESWNNRVNTRLEWWQDGLLTVGILLIIFSGVFIFRPLVNHMVRDMKNVQRAESFTRSILDNTAEGILSIDRHGMIRSFNPAAERIFGYRSSEVIGSDLIRLLEHDSQAELEAGLAEFFRHQNSPAGVKRWEANGVRHDGTVFPMELSVTRINIPQTTLATGIVRDLTYRKQVEKRLVEAEKHESLSILAGGLAHDFNNLLMGISGNASLAGMNLPPDSSARTQLAEIENSCRRAAKLTQQMLVYSGQSNRDLHPIDLNELLLYMRSQLEELLPKTATLYIEPGTDIPSIDADPRQIQEVLLNVVRNAAEALDGQPGEVVIRTDTRNVSFPSDPAVDRPVPLVPGTHAMLSIADTGSGIATEDLPRIFDPFFSTRFLGRGLGLATVRGVIRGHHGEIQVESRPGQGTVLTILLPASHDPSLHA